MRTEGNPEVLEERRRIAARMFEQDYPSRDIAGIVGVHEQTVRAWRRQFDAGGLKALAAKPHPGPPCRLTPEQKQQLVDLLAQPPTAYGYGKHLWTTALIARLIDDRFAVGYSHDHVGVILHQLGYSYQKPTKQAAERDEEAIRRWRDETWPEIVRASQNRGSTLVFVDEAGFSMIPSIHKQWAAAGRTPVVKHRNRWFRKVSVIGGLSVGPDRNELALHMNWHPEANINQERVVTFLQHLTTDCPGTLDIIWDNLSCHRGKLVRAFLETHPQVTLHRLPPYAPDLNPIEMVWSLSKYHRLANHGIMDLNELETQAQDAVDDVARQGHLLRACINNAGLDNALYPSRSQ